jgi:hypothetical protein
MTHQRRRPIDRGRVARAGVTAPLLAEGAGRQHESPRRGCCNTAWGVQAAVVKARAGTRRELFGSATARSDPGHHLGKVATVGEDRGALDNVAS